MLRLLHIEWLKIKNYNTFKVLAILYFISILAISYIGYRINLSANEASNNMAGSLIGNPFSYPGIWNTSAFLASFLFFIPGLFIINLMSNEYNFKTHRQNVIDGLSRMEFIHVKVALCFLTAFFATIGVFLSTIIVGALSKSSFTFTGIEYLLFFFIQTFSYTLFALMLTMFIRRSGLALGLYFLYALILENLIVGAVNYKGAPIGHFFPLESTDKLIPFPFAKDKVALLLKVPPTYALLIASGIYLFIYYRVSTKRYSTVDL